MKTANQLRPGLSGRTLLALLGALITLLGASLHAYACDIESVYLYQNGTPTLQSSDSYTAGHVFDQPGNPIGVVPDPTDGHIYANGKAIGFISPSNAASAELP